MDVQSIVSDVHTYPGPDGRGLMNVHWQGRVVGYSNGGHRDRVSRIPGTNIIARPFRDVPGFIRSTDEIPQHVIDSEKRNFREWVEKRAWFVRGMRVDVIDDVHFRRLEYRIYW
jgi:hypothetical protein